MDGRVQGVEDRAADAIEAALPAWKERAREIAGQIAGAKFVTYLGRGESRASALTAALVTKETAKLPTEAMVGGQFRHGPVEALMNDTSLYRDYKERALAGAERFHVSTVSAEYMSILNSASA